MSVKRNLISLLSILTMVMLASVAHARNVDLGGRSKRICIGQSATLLSFSVQRQWMTVDGQGSRQSTWTHRGQFARLTVDVDTQRGVVAYCQRQGRETFAISWKLAYSDPNVYNMRYTVDCVPCAKEQVKLIKKKINDAVKVLKDTPRGEYREVVKRKVAQTILNAKKELGKIMKDKRTPKHLKKKIKKILDLLTKLYELLMEDQEHSAQVKRLLYKINLMLDQLAKQLKLPAVEVPIRLDGMTPITPAPIEPTPIEFEMI